MSAELVLHEATFRAFGSNCRVVSDIEATVIAAIHRLEDLESRWSRFRADSEISKLNAACGEPVEVSAITADLIGRAMYARERSDGRFNPLMLHQLLDLGYDTTHEKLDQTNAPCSSSATEHPATTEPILLSGSSVRLPSGVSFDPGGVGKGLAADIVAEDLIDAGSRWAVISLGGDIRFAGDALHATGISTNIDDPRTDGAAWGNVKIHGGALASSSTVSRRWRTVDGVHHHLLDPTTGRPAVSARIAATVFAEEAWWADVVAKMLIIDADLTSHELKGWRAAAVVFTADGVEQLGTRDERSAA